MTAQPDIPHALLMRMRDALQRQDDAALESVGAQILAIAPAHEAALAALTARARMRGDLQQAQHWAELGVQRLPRSALLLFHLGAAHMASGALAQAQASLQAAIDIDPDALMARFWLGSAQQASGMHAQSLQTRMHALDRAESAGLLQSRAQWSADIAQQVDAAITAVQAATSAAIDHALAPLRARNGDAALQRIERAFDRHRGKPAPQPTHFLQEPSFLFIPGLPDLPWWDRASFPFLDAIEQQTDAIREELLAVLADDGALTPYIDMAENAPAAPVWRELNRSPRWTGYHFYRHGERVDAHCARCPRTAAALDALPLMRIPGHAPESMFSVLRPGTHIPPHTGVINGRLTVHLPLIVPPNCGALAAGHEMRAWVEGECFVFDDSFVHEAINQSGHTRVVLLFDVWNPSLTQAEREALSAGIMAIGELRRAHGGHDPMQEGAH